MKRRKNQVRGIAEVSHLFLSTQEPQKEKVTIREAAKALNVSKGKIITYLDRGLLTRIKEGGCVYISMDEISALHSSMKKEALTISTDTSAAIARRNKINVGQDDQVGLLLDHGQPENERKDLLDYKDAIKVKAVELEYLKSGINTLKRDLAIQASKLEKTQVKLRQLEKEQQERQENFKSRAIADCQELSEKTQAKLLKMEEVPESLRRTRWKELVGHLLRPPERFCKNGAVLLGSLALLAVVVFSLWWLRTSPKQPSSPLLKGQAHRSETVQASSQAVMDSEMRQKQSPSTVQRPSELLQTTVGSEPESAVLSDQTSKAYSANIGELPSSAKIVSPLPTVDQHIVGQSSTTPPYILRVEALETTWLQVIIDQQQELEYLLHRNDRRAWRAMSGFKLRIGNAAGLQIYLNDQPLKPLGGNGEVVYLQLPDASLIASSTSQFAAPVSRP